MCFGARRFLLSYAKVFYGNHPERARQTIALRSETTGPSMYQSLKSAWIVKPTRVTARGRGDYDILRLLLQFKEGQLCTIRNNVCM